MKTLIIAEAGVNHNGDLDMACCLIDAAVEVGADYIKFQMFKADALVTSSAAKANYQIDNANVAESQHAMLKRLELTCDNYEALLAYAKKKGIGIFSTAFDLDSIRFLVGIGQQFFKIPSGEITNLPYLREIGQQEKPIILSTGMATLGEVEAALNVLEHSGTSKQLITVLHCSTQYPAQMEYVNLRAMNVMKKAFNVPTGYSDHTEGIEVAIAAVALGATVIEKHFTLDRNLPGPDHKSSLEPAQFKAMVIAIRNIEKALGDGCKHPSTNELQNKEVVRKSLVAASVIQAGEVFTTKNMMVKRPGTGISPMFWDDMLGKKAYRKYELDELIE